MAQFGWPNCPPDVRNQIEMFTSETIRILGSNLVGIYLHGSLAMDCFNPERSDVDLLVVIRAGMDVETKRVIADLLLRLSGAPRPIELSFVLEDVLGRWEFPTPFDLHYGEDWRKTFEAEIASGSWRAWNAVVRKDPDLAAHMTVINHRGIRLQGPAIADLFPPIPPADYLASILGDVREARESIGATPVYMILNLCRVLWYVREGQICSKDEGGDWGSRHLPEDYRPLVKEALAAYRGEPSAQSQSYDRAALLAFAGDMLAAIGQHTGGNE